MKEIKVNNGGVIQIWAFASGVVLQMSDNRMIPVSDGDLTTMINLYTYITERKGMKLDDCYDELFDAVDKAQMRVVAKQVKEDLERMFPSKSDE